MSTRRDPQPRPAGARRKVSLPRQAVAGVLAAGVLLLLGEIGAGFLGPAFKTAPFVYVAAGHEEYFGTSRIRIPYFARRPYYWVPMANTPLTNKQGFRGRDWTETKPGGVTRIACLGCSCTMGGQEPYAQRMERLLREALGDARYEVLNAGVGSSSTCQLLQLLEYHVLPMHPDVLIVYSGWNDLAVHDGMRDARHRIPTAWQKNLNAWLQPSQLFHVAVHALARLQRRGIEERVPPGEYADNLRRIVELGREHGANVVLCTFADGLDPRVVAARAFRKNPARDWDNDLYNLYRNKAEGPEAVWRYIVEQYHGAVRTVAQEEHAGFVDLDAELRARFTAHKQDGLPLFKDGIHFTELGHQEVANLLAQHIVTSDERAQVERYIGSSDYYWTNAVLLSAQYQYAAADDFLRHALAGGLEDNLNVHWIEAAIAAQRPFFDLYDAARYELSNGGDREKAINLFRECLVLRPDNDDVRLDLAEAVLGAGRYEEALDLALGKPHNYAPLNMHRALWVGADAAKGMKKRDLAIRCLEEIARRYPQDPLARQSLAALRSTH